MVGCWHGYLSGERCILAYGPADATATPVLTHSCFSEVQIGFTFLVPAHLCSPGKRAVKRVCVCVYIYILITSHIKVMSRIQRPLRSASILSMMVMMMCQAALVSLVTNLHFSHMHIYIRCVEYTRLADCPLRVQSATTMLLLYENNPV